MSHNDVGDVGVQWQRLGVTSILGVRSPPTVCTRCSLGKGRGCTRLLLKDPGGGGGSPGGPTHPPTSEKDEISQRGRKLEVDFRCTDFLFWPLIHPPPRGGGGGVLLGSLGSPPPPPCPDTAKGTENDGFTG